MIFRIIYGLAVIALCVLSFFHSEQSEIYLVHLGISSWASVHLTYRVISVLVLIHATSIILVGNRKIWRYFSIAALLTIFADLAFYFSGTPVFSHSLFIDKENSWLSLLLIAIVIGMLIPAFKSKYGSTKKWKTIVCILLALGIASSRPIYIEDFVYSETKRGKFPKSELTALLEKHQVTVKKGEVLIPFFSTSCGHCRLAAQKLKIASLKNELPNVLVIFAKDTAYPNDAKEFMEEFALHDIPYALLPAQEMVPFSGGRFPSVFWMNEETNIQYRGGKFSNLALQKIVNRSFD